MKKEYNNDSMNMNLSQDEVELIENYRKKKRDEHLAYEIKKTTLLLIVGWAEYADCTGNILTWSTFLDDFDADQYIPFELQKYKRAIYNMISQTINNIDSQCVEALRRGRQ
jgi:hypothetical protein